MRTSRLRRLREEEGQAVVLTYVCLVVLLGMSALVLDVGAWYHAQRQLQASVDAAALAGAQAMPDDPGAAVTLANQYLDKNGGAAARSVGLKSVESANDSVSVSATRHAPGFFSKVLGIESVTVSAEPTATGGVNPSEVTGVAPIAVDEKHPMLQCKPLPCFNEATTLDPQDDGARSIPAGQRRRLPRRHGPADPAGLGTESRVRPEAPRSTSECARYRSASSRYPGSPLVRWLQWPAR
jgi:Flp pilus assembly protein TadG